MPCVFSRVRANLHCVTWTTLITNIQALRPFGLGCILPQTARIILCKTGSDPICFELTASGFVQTDPVRKRAGVQESSGPFLAIGPISTSGPFLAIGPISGQRFRAYPDRMQIGSGMFTWYWLQRRGRKDWLGL